MICTLSSFAVSGNSKIASKPKQNGNEVEAARRMGRYIKGCTDCQCKGVYFIPFLCFVNCKSHKYFSGFPKGKYQVITSLASSSVAGLITDGLGMSASSHYSTFEPSLAAMPVNAGPWCTDDSDSAKKLTIDLGAVYSISKIGTKVPSAGWSNHWVREYSLAYKIEFSDPWTQMGQTFVADWDNGNEVKNSFITAVSARYVELSVINHAADFACLKVQIYGVEHELIVTNLEFNHQVGAVIGNWNGNADYRIKGFHDCEHAYFEARDQNDDIKWVCSAWGTGSANIDTLSITCSGKDAATKVSTVKLMPM